MYRDRTIGTSESIFPGSSLFLEVFTLMLAINQLLVPHHNLSLVAIGNVRGNVQILVRVLPLLLPPLSRDIGAVRKVLLI